MPNSSSAPTSPESKDQGEKADFLNGEGDHQPQPQNATNTEFKDTRSHSQPNHAGGVVQDDHETLVPVTVAARLKPNPDNQPTAITGNPTRNVITLDTIIDEESEAGTLHHVCNKSEEIPFNYVFTESSSQETVYEKLIAQFVPLILNGYDFTFLCAGQSDSGKSHTLFGIDLPFAMNESEYGVIIRTAREIFRNLKLKQEVEPHFQYRVKVSFYEILDGDDVRDFLSDTVSNNIGIRYLGHPPGTTNPMTKLVDLGTISDVSVRLASKVKKAELTGLSQINCFSTSDARECLETGLYMHKQMDSSTSDILNPDFSLSGSHIFFDIHLQQIRPHPASGKEKVTESTLRFIELAGSERITMNRGLIALSNLASALGDQRRQVKDTPPYDFSLLTKLLRDALGGTTITVLLSCLSTLMSDHKESETMIEFSQHISNIFNDPIPRVFTYPLLGSESERRDSDLSQSRSASESHGNLAQFQHILPDNPNDSSDASLTFSPQNLSNMSFQSQPQVPAATSLPPPPPAPPMSTPNLDASLLYEFHLQQQLLLKQQYNQLLTGQIHPSLLNQNLMMQTSPPMQGIMSPFALPFPSYQPPYPPYPVNEMQMPPQAAPQAQPVGPFPGPARDPGVKRNAPMPGNRRRESGPFMKPTLQKIIEESETSSPSISASSRQSRPIKMDQFSEKCDSESEESDDVEEESSESFNSECSEVSVELYQEGDGNNDNGKEDMKNSTRSESDTPVQDNDKLTAVKTDKGLKTYRDSIELEEPSENGKEVRASDDSVISEKSIKNDLLKARVMNSNEYMLQEEMKRRQILEEEVNLLREKLQKVECSKQESVETTHIKQKSFLADKRSSLNTLKFHAAISFDQYQSGCLTLRQFSEKLREPRIQLEAKKQLLSRELSVRQSSSSKKLSSPDRQELEGKLFENERNLIRLDELVSFIDEAMERKYSLHKDGHLDLILPDKTDYESDLSQVLATLTVAECQVHVDRLLNRLVDMRVHGWLKEEKLNSLELEYRNIIRMYRAVKESKLMDHHRHRKELKIQKAENEKIRNRLQEAISNQDEMIQKLTEENQSLRENNRLLLRFYRKNGGRNLSEAVNSNSGGKQGKDKAHHSTEHSDSSPKTKPGSLAKLKDNKLIIKKN